MAHTVKQLGQLRPANTTAASLYSPGASTQTIVDNIIICNTSGAPVTYRLFVDDDGTTYDATTALAWDIALAANSTDVFEIKITMNNTNGNLAVRTNTANGITFTANGQEFT